MTVERALPVLILLRMASATSLRIERSFERREIRWRLALGRNWELPVFCHKRCDGIVFGNGLLGSLVTGNEKATDQEREYLNRGSPPQDLPIRYSNLPKV